VEMWGLPEQEELGGRAGERQRRRSALLC